MRTKALLLTAALGLAGAATSMAQAVYSVNVVGYINLNLNQGFNLVANQLKATPNNRLSAVFPAVPDGSQVLKFQNNNYTRDDYFAADGGWLDSETLEPSTRTVNPGEGFFFYSPSAGVTTLTLVGEVQTGNNLTVPLPAGFSLVSSIVPQQVALTSANGFPTVDFMQYLTFNNASSTYSRVDFDTASGGWIDSETLDPVPAPAPAVGQGFFIYNPTASSWIRSFNPNN